ncbi:MAG TPA: multiheme c-type cytochrome [Acidobacteriota bacterium]|nr:multiheme c-type cytochrome [Acidobacteriota bacterium]
MKSLWTVSAFSLASAALLVAALWGQTPPRDDFIRTDPEKVVLPEACGECHRSALAVWKSTPHATGYDELHAKESAQEIAKAMGFFLIKRESLCLKCHYTPVERRGHLRAGAGVSCESCHGAARDWINVHNVYGVRESDFQKARLLETPAHKAQRLADSDAAGMLRPSNIYAVASNCFQCHTVPHEKLVNVGRHSTGSAGFELLSWSQGELRHNFLESFLTGDGTVNAEREPPRKRMLYLMGRVLDLEYSLRGLSAATSDGRYFKAMKRRYRSALGEVRAIAAQLPLPQLQDMLGAVRGLAPKVGQERELLSAADAVGAAAQRLGQAYDGSQFAALDAFIAGEAMPAAIEAEADEPATTAPDAEALAGDARPASGGAATAASPSSTAAPTGTAGSGADSRASTARSAAPAEDAGASAAAADRRTHTVSEVGRIRSRPPWRPQPAHRTLGPSVCGGCHDHSEHDEWWLDDEHYLTADRLLDEEPKARKIARFYGLSSSQMKRGDQICMQCHGSVISGRESRPAVSGVGCESCHGPGADFKEPHQKDPARGLQLGMVDLNNLETRARQCAGCHYVNEPRLISAGHPTGGGFDLGERNGKIRHWEHELADPAALRTAYQGILQERGGVPSVTRVEDLHTPLVPAAQGSAGAEDSSPIHPVNHGSAASRPLPTGEAAQPVATGGSSTRANVGQRTSAAQTTSSAATSPSNSGGTAAGRLSPAREALSAQGRSIAETLLRIKRRLEELYRQNSKPPRE